MLTCRGVATLLSKDVDGKLSGLDRVKLQAHLAICRKCRQIKRQLLLLKLAIDRRAEFDTLGASPGLSEDFKRSLKRTMRRGSEDLEPDQ